MTAQVDGLDGREVCFLGDGVGRHRNRDWSRPLGSLTSSGRRTDLRLDRRLLRIQNRRYRFVTLQPRFH